MSPILTLQRQMREIGRIRTGQQVASASGGRKHPAKLDTFRLTSEAKELIEAAAAIYGGVVTPWQNPGGGPEWEVITTASSLEIVVPPGQPVSQWYELWSGGGCLRRCDGYRDWLNDAPCGTKPSEVGEGKVIPPCPQDSAERGEAAKAGLACKHTTRLNVILPSLPDLGVWRLESHGYYAAVELAGAADILAMANQVGHLIPARLRLEQREKKIPGKPTNKYAVPIIEFVETRMADLQLTAPAASRLGPGDRPAVPELPSGAGSLPETSDFRAPMSQPDGPGADDEAEAPSSSAPIAVAAPAVAGAVVDDQGMVLEAGMNLEAFMAALEANGISQEHAIERRRAMFPDHGPGPLDDQQRTRLMADLLKEAAAAAL